MHCQGSGYNLRFGTGAPWSSERLGIGLECEMTNRLMLHQAIELLSEYADPSDAGESGNPGSGRPGSRACFRAGDP